MTNIKTYKDGDRFILVLENCTGELAAKVNQFILDVIGVPVTTELLPEIIPETVPAEEFPDMNKCLPITAVSENAKPFCEPMTENDARNIPIYGRSETIGQAMDKGDTAAVIYMSTCAKMLKESARQGVVTLCKAYLRDDCSKRNIEHASTPEIQDFFLLYTPIIREELKRILDASGCMALEDFFAQSNMSTQRSAYKNILDCVIQRTSS